MSHKSCCVLNCGKTRADNIILHKFPDPHKEKERFISWVTKVGDSISSLDSNYIYKNRRICHEHFETKYLTWSRRLSNEAVPTLRMHGFQSEDVVMRDITNIDTTTTRHTVTPSADIQTTAMGAAPSAAEILEPAMIIPEQSSNVVQSPNRTQGLKYVDDKKALVNMLRKVTRKKESYLLRLKKALKLSENVTFLNMMSKFTTLAAIFIAMQFREVAKPKMGRRFTEKEKIMALSVYKQGPRCYRLLSKMFVLPSPLTLSRLIKRADIKAGINEKLFNVIKKKMRNMRDDDKLCVLLFDEIAISPNFEYNQGRDEISGFVTNGLSRQHKIADHALVFMIRGVVKNYKQPVAYTFCSGSTKKEELAMLIKSVIRKLHSSGMRVLGTVCDQGASNVSCINHLISETKAKYLRRNQEFKRAIFEIDDEEVIPLYDPPHLIKGIRNNLLDKDLKCTINGTHKIGKWEHIIKLHQENPSYSGIRLLKNLTEDHINPDKCKMKVKFATQIFSQRVASTMGYLAEKKILPEECKETADILIFFDELFDSVNGSQENAKKRSGKPLLQAVTPQSKHQDIWTNAKKVLASMKFLKNNKEISVPSINNWLQTINNVEYLKEVMFKKYNMKSLWMRHLNQDPLENFFGAVRSHGCRNVNPSVAGFEIAFASLLLTNLTSTHSSGSNCEKDSCKTMFKSIKQIFKKVKTNDDDASENLSLTFLEENIYVDFEEKKRNPIIIGQLEYVTGYILKQTKKNVFQDCISCKEIFFNKERNNEYLRAREFNKSKICLKYPSENLIKMFSSIQDVLMWVLKKHSNTKNIRMMSKTILYIEINTNFMSYCENHKERNTEYIFNLACRFFIFNWCKDINNILRGRNKDACYNDIVQNLALEYVRKRRKNK